MSEEEPRPEAGEGIYYSAYRREKLARQRAEEIIVEKNRDIYELRRELLKIREKLASQQETLLQADKLRSVGQMAAGITHEINNPLAYITSNVRLLNEYHETLTRVVAQQRLAHADDFDSKQKSELSLILEETPEIFSEVHEGLARIGKIVANVKRFARKKVSHRALSDINQEIMAAIRLVEQQLKPDSQIKLRLGDLPLVSCNIHEIGQVVINLILNADHASPARGGIIFLKTMREEQTIVIVVADEGCGIPEDKLESIFDPFFTTKPVGEGTGLGLSVSYSIIEDHGGTISVASEAGKGSIFRIVLPID